MKKILFSHSYFLRFDPKQWKTMQPYPPLGTIYAASVMREANYDVSLFDVMFAHGPQDIEATLEKVKPDYFVIYDDGFNWLTKMCLTNMRHAAWDMAKMAKEIGSTVILSSSDSTDHFEKYLDNGADFVIQGEAEQTLLELVQYIDNGSVAFESIDGVVFRNQEKTKVNKKRAVITQLDDLPSPAWDLIDIDQYRQRWLDHHGYFSLNMVTTRGCPYKCNWCAKPIYGNRYNVHAPDRVVNELERYVSEFKVDHVWFCDDIFGLKPNWVQAFNQLVAEKELVFRYKIQSRVDLLLAEDTAKCLAASGCETVWLGAESGSQKILDAMDKGITVEQIYGARKKLGEHGVRCAFFLQFGYLGEEWKDIEATIRMVLDLMPDEIGVSVSYPLPGTKFYDKVKDDLVDKTNWEDSDDLDMMFSNTYSSDFYRVLQRYIHKKLQEKRSKEAIGEAFSSFGSEKIKQVAKLPYYMLASSYLESKMMKHV